MKADANNLSGIPQGNAQFLIPLYQRYYIWNRND
jgi:hypothetical protein